MESLEFGINFPVNRYIDTWLRLYIFKVVFSTESVVTLIYTWEEYAGNQSNLFLLWVGSSETTREAPFLGWRHSPFLKETSKVYML